MIVFGWFTSPVSDLYQVLPRFKFFSQPRKHEICESCSPWQKAHFLFFLAFFIAEPAAFVMVRYSSITGPSCRLHRLAGSHNLLMAI